MTGPVLFLVATLLAATVSHGAEPPPSVVLITIDTLRADRLGTYGWTRGTSPAIDALAASGTVFEQASATCPATAPSIASIITGLHRAHHGVVRNGNRLPVGVPTLAEVLRAHGYRTAAHLASPVIGQTGFERGADDFTVSPAPVHDGRPVLRAAERFLARHGRSPFFLWVHLLEPHGPYTPPPHVARQFPTDTYRWPDDRPLSIATRGGGYFIIPEYGRFGGVTDPADYRARYDAEIRHTDTLVERLLWLLREHTSFERLVIVFTADHGESLGERGVYFQHGWDAYEPTLRVPLIVTGPGVPAGRRIGTTVSLVDVMPTVLDLADLWMSPSLDGRSLVSTWRDAPADRTAWAQTYYGNRLTILRRGRWKYIWTPPPPFVASERPRDLWMASWPKRGHEELYDLSTDPDERHDLAPSQPMFVRRFRRKTLRWLGHGTTRTTLPAPPASPETTERLRALGYVE